MMMAPIIHVLLLFKEVINFETYVQFQPMEESPVTDRTNNLELDWHGWEKWRDFGTKTLEHLTGRTLISGMTLPHGPVFHNSGKSIKIDYMNAKLIGNKPIIYITIPLIIQVSVRAAAEHFILESSQLCMKEQTTDWATLGTLLFNCVPNIPAGKGLRLDSEFYGHDGDNLY